MTDEQWAIVSAIIGLIGAIVAIISRIISDPKLVTKNSVSAKFIEIEEKLKLPIKEKEPLKSPTELGIYDATTGVFPETYQEHSERLKEIENRSWELE